ncbi:putative nicotinate-nucleotide adenylyltransferase [Diplonema papillatum]|nr:putative nicotinate-nucleotide adenylyltransferase [Diplonema papillatum]
MPTEDDVPYADLGYRTLSTSINNPDRQRRRIAVYGGAYDPPTTAHLQCAAQIIHSKQADEVLIVPCGPRPDKPGLRTSAVDRYVMCQIAVNTTFSPNFPVQVCDIEANLAIAMPTYDLLSHLQNSAPECDHVFVLGSDWLQPPNDIRTWKSASGATGLRLVDEFNFLVIRRPGYEVNNLTEFGPRFTWLTMPDGMQYIDSNLSSTEIRTRASSCETDRLQSIDGLVAPGVLAFVRRRGLYKGTKGDCPKAAAAAAAARVPARAPKV